MMLGIDTVTPQTAIAVGTFFKAYDVRPDQAETLMDDILGALVDAKVKWANLTGVLVFTGPGSFTGLRVGLAAAHGIGQARDIPVYGVSLTDAFAWCTPQERDQMLLLDTRRHDLAVARRAAGEADFGPFTEKTTDGIFAELDAEPAQLCGNGVLRLPPDRLAEKATGPVWIGIDSVIAKFLERTPQLNHGYSAMNTDPIYLRAPDVTISVKKFEHRTLYSQ